VTLAIGVLVTFGSLVAALPMVFALSPRFARREVLGLPLPLVVLGVAIYPRRTDRPRSTSISRSATRGVRGAGPPVVIALVAVTLSTIATLAIGAYASGSRERRPTLRRIPRGAADVECVRDLRRVPLGRVVPRVAG
jgi:hypothetical protein